MKAVLILVLFVGMTSCKNKQDSPVPMIEKEDSLFKNINRDSLFFNGVFFYEVFKIWEYHIFYSQNMTIFDN